MSNCLEKFWTLILTQLKKKWPAIPKLNSEGQDRKVMKGIQLFIWVERTGIQNSIFRNNVKCNHSVMV